jgi:DNA-binding NarL/FixJ family response regulator
MHEPVNSDIAPAMHLYDGLIKELATIGFSVDAILTAPGLSLELREHFRLLRRDLSHLSAQMRDDIFAINSEQEHLSKSAYRHWQEVEAVRPNKPKTSRPLALLTATELEILTAIATGATTLEIAQSRHNSEATVKTHLSAIYRKLQVRNRVEAISILHN